MPLLFFIYIAFIGLGVPDSLFGTAWPAIYTDLGLSFSYGSFVTTIVYLGSCFSCLMSAKLINRLGTAKVAAISTLMTALAMLCYSFSPNLFFIVLSAIPLGLGAGAIDTALNNYVALNYSASIMSFMHGFYGIGVSLSPFIISLLLNSIGWRGSYRVAFLVQAIISILVIISIPKWKEGKEEEKEHFKEMSIKEIASVKGTKLMWILFFSSCAIECTLSAWGATFLVEVKNMLPEKAAGTILFYFIGIAVGRVLSGLANRKWNSKKIIPVCLAILIAGVLFVTTMNGNMLVLGLLLIGMGNGPMFPNLNYMTPKLFGKEESPAIMGTQMTVSYVSFTLIPIIVGQIGRIFGMTIFPYALIIYVTCLFIGCYKLIERIKDE